MKKNVWLRLARASNLPTVWTDVLAGVALGALNVRPVFAVALMIPFSLFYTGGMFLNDAFDRRFDAARRAERPIPSGEIQASTVFIAGFAQLLVGFVLLLILGSRSSPRFWPGVLAGAVLCACIVFYDWRHKENVLAPYLMGLCRALVYITAALIAGRITYAVLFAALISWTHITALSILSRQAGDETKSAALPLGLFAFSAAGLLIWSGLKGEGMLWVFLFIAATAVALLRLFSEKYKNISAGIVGLIAAVCVLDAAFLSIKNHPHAAALSGLLFFVTLGFQKSIKGD